MRKIITVLDVIYSEKYKNRLKGQLEESNIIGKTKEKKKEIKKNK